MNVETIVLKELGIGYPSKNGVRVVAEHINGAIRSGELTCLLGANGVGKSTLLRTLSVCLVLMVLVNPHCCVRFQPFNRR